MQRTKFFKKVVVSGVEELDFLDNSLSNFRKKRDVVYYRIVQSDLLSPDRIAYQAYNNEKFWWIICLVNGIQDIKSDLYIGKIIEIPNILDIYDFVKRWRRR